MPFDTGVTHTEPPLTELGDTSGRVVAEDLKVYNLVDRLVELTTPGSGIFMNTDPGGPPPTNPESTNFRVLDDTNTKILFKADFTAGIDNTYDWVAAFNGAILPVTRNASGVNGLDHFEIPNFQTANVNITANAAAGPGSVCKLISNHPIKISNSGRWRVELSGIFHHVGVTTNTYINQIFISSGVGSDSIIAQNSWNIDTFLLGFPNPSGIQLDFTTIQTLVIEQVNRDHGNVKIGFLIGDVVYYAHEVFVNNNMDFLEFGSLNVPITHEVFRQGTFIHNSIGLYTELSGVMGVAFQTVMDTNNQPALVANHSLNSCVVYGEGADEKDFKRPFTTGTGENYVTVTAPDTYLFSVRPKDEIFAGQINRTVYSIDRLDMHCRSADSQAACEVRVVWNASLTAPGFVDIDSYSALQIDSVASAINLTNAIEIKRITVYANQTVTINKKDILNEYYNAFSRKALFFDGAGMLVNRDRGMISIIASPMSGVATIDVGVTVTGGEVG